MPESKPPEQAAYRQKIIERTLWAVIRAGAVNDDAEAARSIYRWRSKGLPVQSACWRSRAVILPTPRDMRVFSGEVGKAILQSMKASSAKESAGDNFD